MTTLTREVWINAPKEKVWAILADFGNIYIFNPGVPRSYLTSSQRHGVGATRHCDLTLGSAAIEERIVAWTEGESMQIEIYQGTKAPPFKKAMATLTVMDEKDGTRVRGTLEYSLKLGPLGFLMDKLMVTPQFGRAWTGVLAGLKHYAETGELVEDRTPLNLAAVNSPA